MRAHILTAFISSPTVVPPTTDGPDVPDVPTPNPTVAPLLGPGGAWTGTAGVGAVPSAQTRTRSMPTGFFLSAPNITFDDDQLIAVDGWAKGGIKEVRFWCEGQMVVVPARGTHPFTKPDGTTGHFFAWAVRLDHSAFAAVSLTGAADVYAEVVPNDPLFQTRLLGPFRVYARAPGIGAGLRWAAEYTVGAAGTHPTLTAALTAARVTPATEGALIRILDGGTHEIRSTGSSIPRDAWIRITADQPVVLHGDPTTANLDANPGIDGIELYGPNISEDVNRCSLRYEYNWRTGYRKHGIRVFTPEGRDTYGPTNSGTGSSGDMTYIECCLIEDGHVGAVALPLIHNTTIRRMSAEMTKAVNCQHNNVLTDLRDTAFRTPRPSIALAYTGAGTAEIRIDRLVSGVYQPSKTNESSRRVRLLVNGEDVATPLLISNAAGRIHTRVSDVVDWINAQAGFSATAQNETLRAQSLLPPGATGPLTKFDPAALGSTPVQLMWAVDVHSDWMQEYENKPQVHAGFVRIIGLPGNTGQPYFQGGGIPDMTAYCVEIVGTSSQTSQITTDGLQRRNHHWLERCTFLASSFAVRDMSGTGWKDDSGMLDCVCAKFSLMNGASATYRAERIHMFNLQSNIGSTIDSTRGGTVAEEYPNGADGDWTPRADSPWLMLAGGAYKGARKPDGGWNY